MRLFQQGKHKEALAIYKTFRTGFTKAEKRSIEIAYEVLCGHTSFYLSIGIDIERKISEAYKSINNYNYLCNNNKYENLHELLCE